MLTLLGFASGLPFGILAEPLTARLFEAGISKTVISLVTLVSLPYSLKVLWAPFIDRLPLPGLTRRFGRRRGWAIFAQLWLIAAVLCLGASDPAVNLGLTAFLATVTAIASATQDVVLDAYRVESLDTRRQAAGAATMVFGWRMGQLGAGAGGLILADVLPWETVFAILAAAVLVGLIAILASPEPASEAPPAPDAGAFSEDGFAALRRWLVAAVVDPLADFFCRPGWIAIILFILLYKFGDAVLAVMKVPFFLELGFSKTTIAEIVKVFGIAAILAGGFLGGLLVAWIGLARGLLVAGIGMALSNLAFLYLAQAGADPVALGITIAVENVTTGLGTTAFVAYLSSLCSVAYTATQYALLTSLMALSRTTLSAGAGWLADHTSWPVFFIMTTLAAVPGLVLLLWMMRRFPEAIAGNGADGRDGAGRPGP